MQQLFDNTHIFVMLAFQGGHGKFPWEIICGDLDGWIPAERPPLGVPLRDPSALRHAVSTTWIQYFHDSQTGRIPADRRIQLRKVFAGLSPIDPSLSQESSRHLEYIPQQNQETWVLEFTDTVTRCHAPGGMEYPAASVAYAKFLKSSEAKAAAKAADVHSLIPPSFLALPTGSHSPTVAIDGQEKALVLKWANLLPGDYGTLVPELVDAINEFQAHSPTLS
jgi:hypothetical protein